MKLNNDGTATNQEHYKKAAMQPIEVMQRLFTKEQFLGFLMGNYIKYEMSNIALIDGDIFYFEF